MDFDGTISLQDVGDVLLARFAPDQAEVARIDRLYTEGRLGSRDLVRWDMEVLPHDPAVLRSAVAELALDESFPELVTFLRDIGGVIEVVSDGIGFHVEDMLMRLGLADLPVATNRVVPGKDGADISFPFSHPACFVCGTCKRERVREHQAAGRVVVFVGDGTSDRYAVHHADVTFAKASLARYCAAEGIDYQTWERLADVAGWLRDALADGRLPRDAHDFAAWVPASRPGPASFICGPEAWGPGRTTPPEPTR